jgi:hypothetical protein
LKLGIDKTGTNTQSRKSSAQNQNGKHQDKNLGNTQRKTKPLKPEQCALKPRKVVI